MFSDSRFRAMGSEVHLVVHGGSEHAALARRRLRELEARWSRFLPSSEVSRLNAAAGSAVEVSGETLLLLRRAEAAWHLTGGAFDPLLLHELVRAGYDRPFATLDVPGPLDARAPDTQRSRSCHPAGWHRRPLCPDIETTATAARLPAGSGFDPGGIGKGLAADLVTAEVMAAGADGVCLSLGGDVRVRGAAPHGAWTIGVHHPWASTPVTLIGLHDGAVATSSILRRVWRGADGERCHHLIDPATGKPATTEVDLASVVAGDGWMAEALTKSVLLRPAGRHFDLVPDDCAALAVAPDGTVAASLALPRFTGGVLPSTLHFDLHPLGCATQGG